MQKTKLTYKDILVELPIIIHNSHLLTSFLHQLPLKPSQMELDLPASLSELDENSPDIDFYPSLDSLDLSIDPFLEKIAISCWMLLRHTTPN